MKCSKRKFRIYEVPISYHGRTYEEGKKIGWRDGIKALGVILRFWLIDDLYAEPYGRAFLNNLTGTPQYLSWMTRVIRRHVGDTVLEVGAGIGNIAGRLMGRRLRYVAAEKDQLYLHALWNRFLRTPNVTVSRLDPATVSDYAAWHEAFETALCLNVLEYAGDPASVIESMAGTLVPGGRMIVLVPQGRSLYGSVDRTLGHKRRFAESEIEDMLEEAGLAIDRVYQLNKIGKPAWWLFSVVLKRKHVNKVALKLFDKTVWFWRRIDPLLPWRGLSLIVVARKPVRAPAPKPAAPVKDVHAVGHP
jgi:2-polyprenyl-3-methyl-5-hydroxy-6-metoxy-1,4-benzoquinol methylase